MFFTFCCTASAAGAHISANNNNSKYIEIFAVRRHRRRREVQMQELAAKTAEATTAFTTASQPASRKMWQVAVQVLHGAAAICARKRCNAATIRCIYVYIQLNTVYYMCVCMHVCVCARIFVYKCIFACLSAIIAGCARSA